MKILRNTFFVFALICLFFSSCGKTITSGIPVSITVNPSSATVAVGNTQNFSASGNDSSGNPVSFTPTWSVVSNIGTVNSSGIFSATTAGTGKVRATSGEVYGEASVTVTSQATSFRFVVLGDSRNADLSIALNTEKLTQLANMIGSLNPRPAFILFLGDLVSTGGTAQLNEWKNVVAPLTNQGITIYPTVGNHEMANQNLSSQTEFQQAFDLPTNGPGGYDELAYSFEYGNSLFACLDSYYHDGATYHPNDVSDAQINWLGSLLSSSSKTHKFVFTHSPAYPADGHVGSSLDINPSRRNSLWSIIDSNRIDVFFAGHEHIYCRWYINTSVNSNWTNGVYEIISGGAGAPIYGVTRGFLPDVIRAAYHYIVVDIEGNTASIKTYNDSGAEIDSFTVTK